MMQFDVSFRQNETYECGAALLVVLACPPEIADERRLELHRSLCGKALRLAHDCDPDNGAPIMVKPQYVFRDRETITRDLRYVEKRLGERMVAARMAIPLLRMGLPGSPPLPREIKRLSINELAQYVLEDAGQKDTTNVQRRFWAPSRPVIHLAAAAAIVHQIRTKAGQLVALESLLINRAHIQAVVRLAEELERLIARNPKFPVKAEQLIQFRLG